MIILRERWIRLGVFCLVLAVMACWEWLLPRRKLQIGRAKRWLRNLALVVINTLVLRLIFPAAAVGVAVLAQQKGWGLLPDMALPYFILAIISILILDLTVFIQHLLFHAVPLFWRFHRVHHTDLDFDLTTGLRFHPIEIVISMGLKSLVVIAFGIRPEFVLWFEVVLNAMAMFTHSNVRIPTVVERPLRWIFVTPEMHRVHHSILPNETNSNFGFNFSFWDRLFSTYRVRPKAGHLGMTIGLRTFRDVKKCTGLGWILLLPFIGNVTDYAINRRHDDSSE